LIIGGLLLTRLITNELARLASNATALLSDNISIARATPSLLSSDQELIQQRGSR
jgi:hypothetical protein